MALNKTDYGLIYNDDGSLCVTIRKDDVPFEGVVSFAVEEGTTNLIQNPSFENTIGSEWSVIQDVSLSRVSTSSKFGSYSAQVVATKDNSWGGIYQKYSVALGNKYTISVWVRALDTNSVGKNARVAFVGYDSSNAPTTDIYYTFLTLPSDWTLYTLSVTVADRNTTQGVFRFQLNDTVTGCGAFVDGFQVEAKPFATSFVDGTRPDGRLAIPINFRTNLVISGWFKPYGTSGNYNAHGGWARLVNFSNSDDTRRVTLAYNRNDSHPNFRKFELDIRNASGDAIVSTSNVYPFNKWYFWVLIIEDASTTAYIFDENGNMEKIVNTNSIPISDISSSPLYIGHRTVETTDVLNGVISNLLIARYDPATWTDTYIQELYRARKPFAVPPKIPII